MPENKSCPKCGQPNPVETEYCQFCYAPFAQPKAKAAPGNQAPPPPAADPAPLPAPVPAAVPGPADSSSPSPVPQHLLAELELQRQDLDRDPEPGPGWFDVLKYFGLSALLVGMAYWSFQDISRAEQVKGSFRANIIVIVAYNFLGKWGVVAVLLLLAGFSALVGLGALSRAREQDKREAQL